MRIERQKGWERKKVCLDCIRMWWFHFSTRLQWALYRFVTVITRHSNRCKSKLERVRSFLHRIKINNGLLYANFFSLSLSLSSSYTVGASKTLSNGPVVASFFFVFIVVVVVCKMRILTQCKRSCQFNMLSLKWRNAQAIYYKTFIKNK